jgi:hypothetical protein
MKVAYTEIDEATYREIKENGSCLASTHAEIDGVIVTSDIYRYNVGIYAINERHSNDGTFIEAAFCNRLI